MTILDKIIAKKAERLLERKKVVPLSKIKEAAALAAPRDFASSIRRAEGDSIKLIAEIKHASPSEGIIRSDFDLKEIAQTYEQCRVDAVSILTEEDFFRGHLAYIDSAKGFLTCPVLRKDFIFDEYQIYESLAARADAVLLIAAALPKEQAYRLMSIAADHSLHVLFEVHNLKELDMALKLNCSIIGINNRDLTNMKIDLNTTYALAKEIPDNKIIVSESGIKTRNDCIMLEEADVDAVLVGTSIMKSRDIAGTINLLLR
ncbi:MAG: indole-3-glycerol phosphate synthase TrpC [Candidatus Magnetominusculus sp. LBB02]|nr:indole-3-glycerol phosphate synthase TrpC [Candidatus Magnetominusculus sp. LBB02]